MKRPHLKRLALLAFLLSLVLAGCSGDLPEKVWLEAPGWSRGLRVGTTSLGSAAPMDVDSAGNLWLLFLHGDDAPEILRYDPQGETGRPLSLSQLAGRMDDSPTIRWTPDGILLSWIESDQLVTALYSEAGELIMEPEQISGLQPVASYDVAVSNEGEVEFWFSSDADQPGVFTTRLNSAEGPISIDPEGVRPDILFDQNGVLHAIWIQEPAGRGRAPILYWSELMDAPEELAAPNLQPSDVFQGPLLALQDDIGYMLYVISINTGLRAGQVDPMVVSFPLDNPSTAAEAARLRAPEAYNLNYSSEAAGGLAIGPRAPLPANGRGTSQLTQVELPNKPAAEVPLAVRARIDFLMNQNQAQIGLLILDEGVTEGYQLLTFTTGNSQRPSIAIDDSGHAYLTWLETSDARELSVFLASTNPAWVERFASITGDDVQRMALQSLFGMLSGIILIPMVLLWLIAPILVIVVASFIRGAEENWRHPITWVPILIGLALYWLIKDGMLPAIFEYVPFSAWIPIIPEWLAPILRFGLPVAGSLLALWVAFRSTFGQDRNSPTFFILIFGAVDGVVSMMLYGGLFLGF